MMTNEEFMLVYDDYLMHHGVKGQRWGVRRYQNEDGSLTPKGQKHVAKLANKQDSLNKKAISIQDKNSKLQAKLDKKKASLSKNQGRTDKLYKKAERLDKKMAKAKDPTKYGKLRQKKQRIESKIDKYEHGSRSQQASVRSLENKIRKNNKRINKIIKNNSNLNKKIGELDPAVAKEARQKTDQMLRTLGAASVYSVNSKYLG